MPSLFDLLVFLLYNCLIIARIVSIGFVVMGIVLFLIHRAGGFRSLRIPGVLLCAVGGVGLFLLPNPEPSLNDRAELVMDLPAGAEVIHVQGSKDDLGENGAVTFRLPPTRPADKWLDALWEMNARTKSVFNERATIQSSNDQRYFSCSEGFISLNYDRANRTYVYECQLDS